MRLGPVRVSLAHSLATSKVPFAPVRAVGSGSARAHTSWSLVSNRARSSWCPAGSGRPFVGLQLLVVGVRAAQTTPDPSVLDPGPSSLVVETNSVSP